jgi:hypothetical protein
MALELGNLFNAAANIRSSLSKEKSLKSFLNAINTMGIAVKNKYEVNFSGLEEVTFFCTDLHTPGINMKTADIYFDMQTIEIPVNNEYVHEFSMTLLDDGGGYFYTALANFLIDRSSLNYSAKGYTIIVKSLGDGMNYDGHTLTFENVRIKRLGGLDFSNTGEIQTFELDFYTQKFETTPGIVSGVAGVLGGLGSLIS